MNTILYKSVTETVESKPEPHRQAVKNPYYSVEVSLNGLSRQFKLRNMPSTFMSILVKEGSDILASLKSGDILNMRYYTLNSNYPSRDLDTKVKDITKNEQGKFKGHYMIALEIVKNQENPKMH